MTNTQNIYDLVLFILTHQTIIPSALHEQCTTRLDHFMKNREYFFTQCAKAKNRHWGGFNSNGMIYYHTLRLSYSTRYLFEKMCLQYIQKQSQEWQTVVFNALLRYEYTVGYADYVIVPTGGICNRIRTIVQYWHWVQDKNRFTKPEDVKTRLYVIWCRSEHCRQLFLELFDNTSFKSAKDIYIATCDDHPTKEHIHIDENIYVLRDYSKATTQPLYSQFKPKKQLQNKIQKQTPDVPFIAIHVRRTDHTTLAQSKSRFTTDDAFHKFIATQPTHMPIFLATDNRVTQIEFQQRYPERIFWTEDIPPESHLDAKQRRHHDNENTAVIDMFTCVKSSVFKGSGYSSFSDTIDILRSLAHD